MDTANSQPRITYILPTTAWASLLDPIAHDAPAGSVIEVHTESMQALAEQSLRASGRPDIRVCFRQPLPPAMKQSRSSIDPV